MDSQFDLIENIAKLNRMLRRRPRRERQHSHSMHKVLRILLENDGMRAADLAVAMDIRPSSLTDVLKRLEEQEYVYKVKDENDSRVSLIHATEKAKKEFDQRNQQNEQAEWIKACLTEEEIELFCLTCGKLISYLESVYPEVSAETDHRGRYHHHSGDHNHHSEGHKYHSDDDQRYSEDRKHHTKDRQRRAEDHHHQGDDEKNGSHGRDESHGKNRRNKRGQI